MEWLLIDDGLASRKRRHTILDPSYHYIGIGSCHHSVHDYVTVIVLAENVTSLVAPGTDGKYLRRNPVRQEGLFEMVVNKSAKNEKAYI